MGTFFICKTCGIQSEDVKQLIHHNWFKHRINAPETVLEYVYDNVIPQCQCGCGEAMKYFPTLKDYAKWKAGHKAKVESFCNDIGRQKSKETLQKLSDQGLLKDSVETRKKKSIARQGDKNPMFNKHHTDKTKVLVGNATKERLLDPKIRQKIESGGKEYWDDINHRHEQRKRKFQNSDPDLLEHRLKVSKDLSLLERGEYVYIIKGEIMSFYKIGYTANSPYQRLTELQHSNPDKLSVIQYYKSMHSKKLEKLVHEKFKEKRKIGEWFELSEEDLKNFKGICEAFEKVLAV